jgi:hypothetical protein
MKGALDIARRAAGETGDATPEVPSGLGGAAGGLGVRRPQAIADVQPLPASARPARVDAILEFAIIKGDAPGASLIIYNAITVIITVVVAEILRLRSRRLAGSEILAIL